MLTAAFSAIGCKLNQYEIQSIAETLEPYGFRTVPFTDWADLYIINTCTVTGQADFTSRQMIRRALRNNPQAKIIITGCYAELEPEIGQSLGENIIIVSNNRKQTIPEIALKSFGITSTGTLTAQPITRMNGHSRAFVKIQDGCREKCSYCVIWKARGLPISRPPEQVIEEINVLYDNCYYEVVLTGVHIGRYKNELDLAGLLKQILVQTKMPRIRLSSLKPNEFKDELIELIDSEKRICPHIHLPIQSGDKDILQAMGRKYSPEAVCELVNKLAEIRPDITIGADIIVGFPGESDDNFANTVTLIKDNPINHLHVFSYSDRVGTPASAMLNKIPPEIKAKRSNRLRQIGKAKALEHARKFIGKTLDIIVEDREKSGKLNGISGNYLRVEFEGDDLLRRKLIEISIDSIGRNTLIGNSGSLRLINNN